MGFRRGLLVGFGAGYVLGARAGRERYEQIQEMWNQLTGNPRVQQATQRTREIATERARRGMEAVQTGVQQAGSAVKGRLNRGDTDTELVIVDEIDEVDIAPAGTAQSDLISGGTVDENLTDVVIEPRLDPIADVAPASPDVDEQLTSDRMLIDDLEEQEQAETSSDVTLTGEEYPRSEERER